MPRPKRAKIVSSQRAALKESTASKVNSVSKGKKNESDKTIQSQLDGAGDDENSVGYALDSQHRQIETPKEKQKPQGSRKSVHNVGDDHPRNDIQKTPVASSKSSPLARQSSAEDDTTITRSRRLSTSQVQDGEDLDTISLPQSDDSLELSFDTALEGISPDTSAQRVPNTPSMLSIANFKRRPRQPSLLRMVQLSAQKPTYGESEPAEEGDTSFHSADGYSSTPSTNDSGGAAPQCVPQPSSVVSHKRKSLSDGNQLPQKKRKSLEYYHNLNLDWESEDFHSSSPAVHNVSRSPSSALPDHRARLSRRGKPEIAKSGESKISRAAQSSTIEEPATPLPTVRKSHSRKTRHQRLPSPVLADSGAPSPVSSSPVPIPDSTQERKNSARTGAAKIRTKQSRITTASLQALLPKTHKKPIRRKELGIQHSSDGSSEESEEEDLDDDDFDELQRSNQTRRRHAAAKPQSTAKVAMITKGRHAQTDGQSESLKVASRKNAAAATAQAMPTSNTAPHSSHNLKKRANQRTYGSNSASALGLGREADRFAAEADADNNGQLPTDEEAEDEDAEGASESSLLEASKSKELRTAAKKFEEVDEWELEFESCDIGGENNSSPWR